jgi:hypothetical protein
MKPTPGPACPCGRVLLRTDISSNTRGRRICWVCARKLPTPQPSPEAQAVMDLMDQQPDYASAVHIAMVALGRRQGDAPAVQPKPTTRRTRTGQGTLGVVSSD